MSEITKPDPANIPAPSSAALGQLAHPAAIDQGKRLERKMYQPTANVWCLVGNGLSNQTFIAGPEGIIAVDTGDSVEEMRAALVELRKFTLAPVVAIIYTHFHYVNGTAAIFEEMQENASEPTHTNALSAHIDIVGHHAIATNRKLYSGEIAPKVGRGIVAQFGLYLPKSGPDGFLHCGLGRFYRNPEHAPHTSGYIPANITIKNAEQLDLAGLKVELTPAPSDATDSLTIWIPSLQLCINNLIWPSLFNIYAIRGEAYRDPKVLLEGIDHIIDLEPRQLVSTHGAPFPESQARLHSNETSGTRAEHAHQQIQNLAIEYRDSIQYLWDQTVRGANAGLNLEQIINQTIVNAPQPSSHHTEQLYGLAEHHIRQIYNGLFGWFDEDPSKLFPLNTRQQSRRLIKGFGGAAHVRQQVKAILQIAEPPEKKSSETILSETISRESVSTESISAQTISAQTTSTDIAHTEIADDDLRWAIQLCSWLINAEQEGAQIQEDRTLMARIMRHFAQQTTSANIRNWCLTHALEQIDELDLSRQRQHKFNFKQIMQNPAANSVYLLKVLLNPEWARGLCLSMAWHFAHGEHIALSVRHHVAAPIAPEKAELSLTLSHETWAEILCGNIRLSEAIHQGTVSIEGEANDILQFFACFEHAAFN